MTGKTLHPNTFQHHNAYVDIISFFITGNEEKVLNKILREIMGWAEKRETLTATVSISVLVDGKFSRATGERLTYGCGLSESTVRKILHQLCDFGLIERVGAPTQDGQAYKLQLDWEEINWGAMHERRAEKDTRYRAQIEKARESNPLLLNKTPSVEQEGGGSVEREAPPSVEQNPKNPCLNPHVNPDTSTDVEEGANAPQPQQSGFADEILSDDQVTDLDTDRWEDQLLKETIRDIARAKTHRKARGPRKFQSLAQKREWRKAVSIIKDANSGAPQDALREFLRRGQVRGLTNMAGLVPWIAGCARNGGRIFTQKSGGSNGRHQQSGGTNGGSSSGRRNSVYVATEEEHARAEAEARQRLAEIRERRKAESRAAAGDS